MTSCPWEVFDAVSGSDSLGVLTALHRHGRPRRIPQRVATLSVHTSPLEQPGMGDAGGMNVYIVETAKRLADVGIEVDIFTRATSRDLPPTIELAPGVTVRHVIAGPSQDLPKEDLPAQLCAFTSGVLRADESSGYDIVHSHYWLSGQVGWLAKERWQVPLVHSMHTMARVKNQLLADGDTPEPMSRIIGEAQVVDAADRLVANTAEEASQLVSLYRADADRVVTVPPGVDLDVFRPGAQHATRRRLGIAADAAVLLFVGRIQPLKAPDVLLRAAADLLAEDPTLRKRLVVAVVGGPSGSGLAAPESLQALATTLDVRDVVRFVPPLPQQELANWYVAADVTVVPSYNESFGLVAVEAQACGTPFVAARVGGLTTAVADGVSGVLIDGHHPTDYADVLADLLTQPRRRAALSAGALAYAQRFGWSVTAARLIDAYAGAMEDLAAPVAMAVGR
jgi:D-inositol-3-phosphate glycosyltransferase